VEHYKSASVLANDKSAEVTVCSQEIYLLVTVVDHLTDGDHESCRKSRQNGWIFCIVPSPNGKQLAFTKSACKELLDPRPSFPAVASLQNKRACYQ